MQPCSRREFIKHGLCSGLSLGTGHLLTGCGADATITPEAPPFAPSREPARVAAVRGQNLEELARKALEACGGAGAIVAPGETVFIKPNLVGAGMVRHPLFSTGECTKPEIFLTVAEECLKADAKEVIIGDAGQVDRFSWDEMLTLDGSVSVAEKVAWLNGRHEGTVRLACLNTDTPHWDAIPAGPSGLGRIYVSSLVSRADRIISIPVIKTHRFAQMTLSLKNLMGVTSAEFYGQPGITYRTKLHNAPAGLEQAFLDIATGLRPDLTIIDGSIGCEGNGPHVMPGWWGTTVDLRDRLGDWVLLASRDPLAADATAARMVGHEPSAIRHLLMSFNQGLGQLQEDLTQLDGATLDELRIDWVPAEPVDGFNDVILEGIAMLLERSEAS
ncbi:MAG: DUF362 domain-containing protein [Phycisphaerales bacterium]|nr:MAG: DUF362 domain-containing protein [Phycisphaerales bacterium]